VLKEVNGKRIDRKLKPLANRDWGTLQRECGWQDGVNKKKLKRKGNSPNILTFDESVLKALGAEPPISKSCGLSGPSGPIDLLANRTERGTEGSNELASGPTSSPTEPDDEIDRMDRTDRTFSLYGDDPSPIEDKTEHLLRLIGSVHLTREKAEQCWPQLKPHLDGLISRGAVGVQPDGELYIAKRA